MVFNTATIGTAVTPAVVGTFFSHYVNRSTRAEKPTADISYDEGLNLIRKFLIHVSHHTVEDIQGFSAQWVPHPTWVRVDVVKIPKECLASAAEAIQAQLGHHGIEKVGGKSWWQWRRPGNEAHAEWIEMKSDYVERKKIKDPGKRVMLYVHGGAYFFGSVDMHRYQLQRHARKLKARVFARYTSTRTSVSEYRLAPQFPFPCGLQDCLASYLYLLTIQDPATIIFAGDSAGGGMVVSLLVILRDRGLPLPAGAILISPWVDLTHSFPSVSIDSQLDYIPPHGFHQRPSASWPPPNSDDMLAISEGMVKKLTSKDHVSQAKEDDAVRGFHVNPHPSESPSNGNAAIERATSKGAKTLAASAVPGPGHDLSIMIDGKLIEIKDQIQMYTTNQLISHPLVSPILQPSLGGLPPLLILTGGGEVLRDEQIYLAHKAANPAKYLPGDAFLDENPHDHKRDEITRWKPTDVQLQVWDDLCHVAPTLSFTRPAKYMYRSIAQFGAWALARAQKTEIEILDDDDISIISDSEDEDAKAEKNDDRPDLKGSSGSIGRAGDPLPPFKNHMIRQRVDRHGDIFPLNHATSLPGCMLPHNEIGVIKEGPVRKWMAAKLQWDTKFSSSKRRVQKQRAKEMAKGYQTFGDGEVPPPSALAGRRQLATEKREGTRRKSVGLSMWSGWGSKHDKETMDRELQADKEPDTTVTSAADGANANPLDNTKVQPAHETSGRSKSQGGDSRSRSRRRTVTDQRQTEGPSDIDENTPAAELLALRNANGNEMPKAEHLSPLAATARGSGSARPASLVVSEMTTANVNESGSAQTPAERASVGPQGTLAASPAGTVRAQEIPLNVAETPVEKGKMASGAGGSAAYEKSLDRPAMSPAGAKSATNDTQEITPEKSEGTPRGHARILQIAADNSKHTIKDTPQNLDPEKMTTMANEIPTEILQEKPVDGTVENATVRVVEPEPTTEAVSTTTEPAVETITVPATVTEPEASTEVVATTVATTPPTAIPIQTTPVPAAVIEPETSTVAAAAPVEGASSKAPAVETAADPAKAVVAATVPAAVVAATTAAAAVIAAPASAPTAVKEVSEKAAAAAPVSKVDAKASNIPTLKTKGKTFSFSFRRKSTIDATKQKESDVKFPPVPAAKVEEKAKELVKPTNIPVAPAKPTTDKKEEPAKPIPAPTVAAPAVPAVVEPQVSQKKSISKSGDITYPETPQSTRPKSKGIAFPFSLKRRGSPAPSSASVATISSASNIPPAKAVSPVKAVFSGASKEAIAKPKAAVDKVVQNGGLAGAAKPPVNTVVAPSQATLPVPGAKVMDSDQRSINSTKSVNDYLTW